ncbi:MAG: glycosyltransferase family 2 protein [Acidaminococcaceae bacterium]|nr:glycosyltransferase family 2 protein [Acidaminococcaceae bacterium]
MNQLASIIIPVYNVEKHLKQCLDSVLNQSYKNTEIIIIDDGSTDDSGNICESYRSDQRVKIIHQTNAGLGEARNTGLNHANGEYIFFVDSDDFVSNNFVSRAVEELYKYNADLVIFNYIESYENGSVKEIQTKAKGSSTLEIKKKIVYDDVENYAWNKAYRSHLWKKARFTQRWFEDISLIPYIANSAKKILSLNEPLYYYRIHNTSYLNSRKYNPSRDYLKLQTQISLEQLAHSFNDITVLNHLKYKILDEATELAILNYYLNELTPQESLLLETIIKKNYDKAVLSLLGRKVSLMRKMIIYTPSLACAYGKWRYSRKCTKI